MEELKNAYKKFEQAYTVFEEAVSEQERLERENMARVATRNLTTAGVIQHFEFTYEMCWLFLKEYLLKVKEVKESYPKAIFRACYEHGVLPIELTDELINLINDRNKTAHIYSQEMATRVFNSIQNHYIVFGKVLKSIKMPENS